MSQRGLTMCGAGIGLVSWALEKLWKDMPDELYVLGLVVGGVLVAWGLVRWWTDWRISKIKAQKEDKSQDKNPIEQEHKLTPAPDGTIPLPEAARALYEAARTKGRLLATMAERMSGGGVQMTDGTPPEILDHMATYIAGKAAIWGCRPPSEKREYIPTSISKWHVFESGALVLKSDKHVFTDLVIDKIDLFKIIIALDSAEI